MKFLKVNVVMLFTLFFLLNSCNKHFTKFPFLYGKNKIIRSAESLPPVIVKSNKPLKIISISMLNRQTDIVGYTWIPKVEVTKKDGEKHFKLILSYIDSIQKNKALPIIYNGSRLNDSMYKPIYNRNFVFNYSHSQMQQIDFSSVKTNGVYMIVTYILQATGGVGGGGASAGGGATTISNTLYEFFKIENGKLIGYNGYSLGRNDSFRRVSQKRFPKYKDLVKVFKMLYKDSEKYYGKIKKSK